VVAIALVFYGITWLAILIQLVGLGLFFRFILKDRPRTRTSGQFPGVTVLKACFRTEDSEAEHFERFFNQDYPGPLQLLFVASDEGDPAAALVRSFIERYPKVDAKLIISKTRKAYWAKIDAVYDGHLHAAHDFFIISDSDALVTTSYVRQMVGALEEPGISLVSTPQWDYGANNAASAFKVLGNNVDSAVFVLWHIALSNPKDMALGHSIGFRLSEFRTLSDDNWAILNTFLAEDLAYGFLFARAGKKVVLRNIFCPVSFKDKTLKQVYSQKIRWLINQKMAAGNRYVYMLGTLLYPEVPALCYAVVSRDLRSGALLFGAAAASRIVVSAFVERLYVGAHRTSLKYFWTIPLWDLSQIYFFCHGFFKTSITYGKKTYRVVNRCFLKEIPS
jgi:ceramide glucosyltransferase